MHPWGEAVHSVGWCEPTSSSLARSISELLWMELWNFWWLMICCSMAAGSSPQEAVSIRRWSTRQTQKRCSLIISAQQKCSVQILSCRRALNVTSRWWQRFKLVRFFFTVNISGMNQKIIILEIKDKTKPFFNVFYSAVLLHKNVSVFLCVLSFFQFLRNSLLLMSDTKPLQSSVSDDT